jgi:hypothetical protein
MHPTDDRERRRLARVLSQDHEKPTPLERQGYLVWREGSGPRPTDRVAEEARRVLASGELDRMREACARQRKNFAVTRLDEHLSPESPFLAFALDPLVLGVAAEHLGALPVLGGIFLWYSPNQRLDENRDSSQRFHIDPTGYRQVKVFVHVHDVSDDTGPLTVVPAPASRRLYSLFGGHTGSLGDDVVERIVGRESIVPLTGPAGTVSVADTSRCFHFGSRPGARERVLVHFHFLSPYAPTFPFFGRLRVPRYAHLATSDRPPLERYVLGAR